MRTAEQWVSEASVVTRGGGWAASALPVSPELLWLDLLCSDFIREMLAPT